MQAARHLFVGHGRFRALRPRSAAAAAAAVVVAAARLAFVVRRAAAGRTGIQPQISAAQEQLRRGVPVPAAALERAKRLRPGQGHHL